MLGVSFGTAFLGILAAWLTTMCQFPGRAFFTWALLLPITVPPYIMAYAYSGFLSIEGILQSSFAFLLDWTIGEYNLPQLRSLTGSIIILSFTLYPYVFLAMRVTLIQKSKTILEVSRSLGCTPWRSLFFVALPLSRPAIAGGVSLVLMETLADYGTVQYFGVPTLTTGIFRAWFSFGELNTAAQLSALLMVFIFVLILIESYSRQKLECYQIDTNVHNTSRRLTFSVGKTWLCTGICTAIFLLAFLIPVTQMFVWSMQSFDTLFTADYLILVQNSFLLAISSAVICLAVAIFFTYSKRFMKKSVSTQLIRFTNLGYAMPGAVVAIGVLAVYIEVNQQIISFMHSNSGNYFLINSIFILLFAYLVRFLALAQQSLDAGMAKLSLTTEEVARSLGTRSLKLFMRIQLPMLRSSLLAAILLIFVEVLKELPATLILRPFNFNTLAIKTYELASDEQLVQAALPALTIVLISVIPISLVNHFMVRSKKLAM